MGTPGETYAGLPEAGVVNVIYGSSSGLTTRPAGQLWHQGKVPGDLGSGDRFGHSLTTGDFNGDRYDDLAVGAPYDDYAGFPDAGVVNVIYGGPTGLGSNPSLPAQEWIEDEASGETAGEGDLFGWALTSGRFGTDGFADLAVGAPYVQGCEQADDDAGAVTIMHGFLGGLGQGFRLTGFCGAVDHSNDHFGWALAAQDVFASGQDLLATGTPGSDLEAPYFRTDAGEVALDTFECGDPCGSGSYQQSDVEDQDFLGYSLAGGDFDGDGYADLVIGVPEENLGTTSAGVNAGIIHVLYGSSAGLTTAGTQVWSQKTSTTPLKDKAEAQDRFGGGVWG